MLRIDRAELVRAMNSCIRAKVRYRLGAKARPVEEPGVDFNVLDCSGFLDWLINRATHGVVDLPAGSWFENKWFAEHGFAKVPYLDCAKVDDRLRLGCFPARDGIPGHIWLVINGLTIECCGGKGVCRRPWDTSVLFKKVFSCYLLTDVLK
jgi:hypothetical protein